MAEQKVCDGIHKWDGNVPVVKTEIHSVQFPELMGKACDCGKFIWDEALCGCPGDKHWEAKITENMNK